MTRTLFYPRGALARDGWESVVEGELEHAGLRVAELATGDALTLDPGFERIVVPLSGSFTVTHLEETVLPGRSSVFDGPTDVLYLSCETTAVIRGEGRVAVAESSTDVVYPTRLIRAAEIPVEIRGTGAATRHVYNFGTPATLDAARLIVCEVITPAGNWSSYPPHKHDEHKPGIESQLEEIYYFESQGFGTFFTDDIAARVRTGDIALVPSGYHGPAGAPPDYDLYYLNVMAGPGPEREWLITVDPEHEAGGP